MLVDAYVGLARARTDPAMPALERKKLLDGVRDRIAAVVAPGRPAAEGPG